MKFVEIAKANRRSSGPYTATIAVGSNIRINRFVRLLCGFLRHVLYSWSATPPAPKPKAATAVCQNVSMPLANTGAA